MITIYVATLILIFTGLFLFPRLLNKFDKQFENISQVAFTSFKYVFYSSCALIIITIPIAATIIVGLAGLKYLFPALFI